MSAAVAETMSNPFLPQVCPEDALTKFVVDPWLPTSSIVDSTSPLRLDRCSLDGEYDSAVRGHCYTEFDQKGYILYQNYKECQYSPLLLPGWNLLPDWFLQGTRVPPSRRSGESLRAGRIHPAHYPPNLFAQASDVFTHQRVHTLCGAAIIEEV